MSDIRLSVDRMVTELKHERDELKVKLHLARMDAGDEWQKLETRLAKLDAKARELGNATAEASHEIGAAAKLLGEEIRKGLKTIGKHL